MQKKEEEMPGNMMHDAGMHAWHAGERKKKLL